MTVTFSPRRHSEEQSDEESPRPQGERHSHPRMNYGLKAEADFANGTQSEVGLSYEPCVLTFGESRIHKETIPKMAGAVWLVFNL